MTGRDIIWGVHKGERGPAFGFGSRLFDSHARVDPHRDHSRLDQSFRDQSPSSTDLT